MTNPSPIIVLTLMALVFSSCNSNRPGDGREGGSDKHEWSILQALEATHRSTRITGVEVTSQGDYQVASLMADDGQTRIWIMLDPASPPLYKQMPSNINFSLTEHELEKIRSEGHPTTTTYQALESHSKTTDAEQDAAGNHH